MVVNISGESGFYNGYVQDKDVETARNAEYEYANAVLDSYKTGNPLEFQMTYSSTDDNGSINIDALLGAAFEEVLLFTNSKLDSETGELYFDIADGGVENADMMDFDGDGRITVDEYATSLLYFDIQDDGKTADGIITSDGQNAGTLEILKNKDGVADTLSNLYSSYNLGSLIDDFYSVESNAYNFLQDDMS